MDARSSNACAAMTEDEFQELKKLANQYLDARGPLTGFFDAIGKWLGGGLKRLPENWIHSLHLQARDALWWAYNQAIIGMDAEKHTTPASSLLYRALSSGSGAATGAAGLAGIAIDLPTSTLLILRSLADIARAKGLDIADPDVRAACLEAFAFGGPTDEDDNADLAFWTTRAAAPEVAEFIMAVASRYTSRLAVTLPAKTVPVVSALASAAINWHFVGFFQNMGEILLSLRPLEKNYDREMVRTCFAILVKELREQRQARLKPRKSRQAASAGRAAVNWSNASSACAAYMTDGPAPM